MRTCRRLCARTGSDTGNSGTWRSFESLFDNGYKQLSALKKKYGVQIGIAEFSCATSKLGDKPKWFTDGFNAIKTKYSDLAFAWLFLW